MSRSLLLCLLMFAPLLAHSDDSNSATPRPVVLVLGDSLSAGYGLDATAGWVHLLKQKLDSEELPHSVVNASVSGETTRGGLSRLPGLLDRHQPEWVLIQLGGNDGLRALPIPAMRENLEAMVSLARSKNARPVLFQMFIPANYGPDYTEQFTSSFSDLADRLEVPLVPFLLAPFAFDAEMFQSDGIHPAAEAQALMLDVVWGTVGPLLGCSKRKASVSAASGNPSDS